MPSHYDQLDKLVIPVQEQPRPYNGASAPSSLPVTRTPEATRYLVFSGEVYYAAGGWRDFKAGFSDQHTAFLAADDISADEWVEVVDLQDRKVIYKRFEAYGTPTSNPFVPA